MSAHSFLEINGHTLLWNREAYSLALAALFTEDEAHRDDGLRYSSTVQAMLDRLQLQGFTTARARAELDQAVHDWHSRLEVPSVELDVPVRDSAMIIAELEAYLNSTDEYALYDEPHDVFYPLDLRTILRLALDFVTTPDSPVHLNLDGLIGYELLRADQLIAKDSREDYRITTATDAPLVILTEGSTDSQLLNAAIQVTHPHLVGFMRFMDFSSGAEGNAASLAKLVRSFVGAGIANRVLALQ